MQKRLLSNPRFVRVCGYAPKDENHTYCFKHVPRLRKLQQFDATMRDWGLWETIKWEEVQRNIKEGVIKKENELAHTSVERMIKQLKCDLSDDRLSKRGTASFQAYLDKSMIAFHILLRN